MDETTARLRGSRRSFSIAGFAFVILTVAAILAELAFLLIPKWMGWDTLTEQPWWVWVRAAVPMYLVAFPACALMLHIIPSQLPERRSLTMKQFLTLIPICFCLMYAGNLVGTLLSLLLSGGEAVNKIESYAMDQSWLKVLVMVILAPLMEELVFRKLLIDRTVRYGEKLSVLMSGLIFGLIHQNLFQFFYAFALGSLFAYVYIRTGRVRYTVLLHAIVNFLGGVIAPAVVSVMNSEAMARLDSEKVTPADLMAVIPGVLLVIFYTMSLLGISIFGLVLLIIKRRKLVWKETEQQLPKKPALKAAFLNVGMIVYILVCLVMMVLALFN